jgi:hypothetical protein
MGELTGPRAGARYRSSRGRGPGPTIPMTRLISINVTGAESGPVACSRPKCGWNPQDISVASRENPWGVCPSVPLSRPRLGRNRSRLPRPVRAGRRFDSRFRGSEGGERAPRRLSIFGADRLPPQVERPRRTPPLLHRGAPTVAALGRSTYVVVGCWWTWPTGMRLKNARWTTSVSAG